METDATTAPEVPARTAVPLPTAAKAKMINVPVMVEEAGLTIWSDIMLNAQSGGRATNWEQWANSFSGQFKCFVDTITQSLRIKEDSYIKIFAEKEKVAKNHRLALEKIKQLEKEAEEANVTIGNLCDSEKKPSDSDDSCKKLENEDTFLKTKFRVAEEKLKSEIKCNINFYSTVLMNKELSQDSSTIGTMYEDKKIFLLMTNCIEVLNPVPPGGNMVCLMDNYLETVSIYGLDSCMFMTTDEPCAVGVMMRITAELCVRLDKDRPTEWRETER